MREMRRPRRGAGAAGEAGVQLHRAGSEGAVQRCGVDADSRTAYFPGAAARGDLCDRYENTYMFSRRDGVLLGGTHEMGDWNLQPDMATKAAILAKQAELFGGMKDC